MQVLDDRIAADDIEEAYVALAVSHNVEILDDVAVAVKLARRRSVFNRHKHASERRQSARNGRFEEVGDMRAAIAPFHAYVLFCIFVVHSEECVERCNIRFRQHAAEVAHEFELGVGNIAWRFRFFIITPVAVFARNAGFVEEYVFARNFFKRGKIVVPRFQIIRDIFGSVSGFRIRGVDIVIV